VNSLSTQHEWADELQDISKFEGRSVAWNIRNKTFRPDPLELEGFKLEDTWEDQNRDTRSPEGTQSYQKGSETPETSRETSPEGVIKIRDSIFIRFELGASSKVNTTKQAWQRQSFINQSTWADMIDYENDMNDMADDTEDDTGDYDREQGPWSP
jgi:hypothetical protein